MAKKQEILQELATWVAETVDIAKIIATHNKGLPQEDPAYVVPIDNKSASIKQKTQPYGVKVVVNQSTKRDAVMAKIWEKMSAKNMMERIEEKYIETFKENGITVTVDTFTLSRFADISSGSKSIKLSLQEYNDDGTKRTVKSTGNLADPTKALVIFAKALRTVQGDPHELMSGILIATNKIYDENSINGLSLEKRNKKLEEICQEIFDNRKKVDGYKEKEAKLIEGDIVNLAKALSISNYINKLLRRNSASNVEVYQTGAKWSKNIAKFKGKDKSRDTIIKSYNSSDLIIKFNLGKATHHWGLSLKKKGYKVNEVDPTLLNKPIVGDAGGKKTAGFLFLKAGNSDVQKLKNAEDEFFKDVYRVRFDGEEPKTNNASWKKKLNDGLAGDEKKAALTGKEFRGRKYPKNTFFEEIDRVFRKVMKDDNNFKELLDLVFRLDIDEYVNQENFHFSLITGIGGLEPNGKIKINKPNEKNSVFLKQVFTSMFQGEKVSNIAKFDGNFKMPTTKGKFQAFDNRATAAKLFYTMFIDSLPIVDLEVRYKGTITAKPQLQVFITRRFNNFLKSAQRKMQNLGVHAYLK
tara:strand:+ start:250 stop:1989 length:1740 start_codon:yes stop_codon:yes gene_type:complete